MTRFCNAQLARNPDVPLVVTSEEELEREVGMMQEWHRGHGAHQPDDMAREAGSSSNAAETKAAYGIAGRPAQRQSEPRVIGLLVSPALISDERLAAVFTGAAADIARQTSAVRACLKSREDGALFIVPSELANLGMRELRQTSGVRTLCLCVGSASHSRGCLFA